MEKKSEKEFNKIYKDIYCVDCLRGTWKRDHIKEWIDTNFIDLYEVNKHGGQEICKECGASDSCKRVGWEEYEEIKKDKGLLIPHNDKETIKKWEKIISDLDGEDSKPLFMVKTLEELQVKWWMYPILWFVPTDIQKTEGYIMESKQFMGKVHITKYEKILYEK